MILDLVENELNDNWLSSLRLLNEGNKKNTSYKRKEEIKIELERRENSKLVEIK
ncbi:MAG: hypothetical protein M0P71_12355 [Melioribacteraceae bacterium]|jgi:hypothetical protein|nr:hypothetical protein [Melioribacteraceae bacterium]